MPGHRVVAIAVGVGRPAIEDVHRAPGAGEATPGHQSTRTCSAAMPKPIAWASPVIFIVATATTRPEWSTIGPPLLP